MSVDPRTCQTRERDPRFHSNRMKSNQSYKDLRTLYIIMTQPPYIISHPAFYGTSDKGPSKKGTTSLQRTLFWTPFP